MSSSAVTVSLCGLPSLSHGVWHVHDLPLAVGVQEAMIGMKVGETRDIQLTLPDNFEPAPLRGVDVTCTVGVTELFEYSLAEVMPFALICLFETGIC